MHIKTSQERRDERLQKLFADCQQQVIGQIIGPFGLSTAMFADKNGGNVTTMHNFERKDDAYLGSDADRHLHAHSREVYSGDVRSRYEIDTKEKAAAGDRKTWEQKRAGKIAEGKDDYTGKDVAADGTIAMKSGIVGAELDHVVSIGEVHRDPKMHLGLGKVTTNADGAASVDVARLRAAVNADENLALTNQPLNGSKSDEDLQVWAAKTRKKGGTNAEKFEADEALIKEKYEKAKQHIDDTANRALFEKQATELLQTGGKQALQMGLRQALGMLLTELVNGVFNEFKLMIKHGVEQGSTLFEEIRARLAKVIAAVVKKVPDAIGQLFEGGVSGFMSNLLTFVLNSFFSTAKRFVTVIREGLIGLFRAFKMIFFPPKHMEANQALQEGLKILTAVLVTSVGLLLTETVSVFMATLPFLKPVADMVAPVLIGIVTGLLSAFLAYQIDILFDRYRHSLDEKFIDELMADAKRRDDFSNELVTLSEQSLDNIDNYARSISMYQSIGVSLGAAGRAASATGVSLVQTIADTDAQVGRSLAMVDFINDSQAGIDDFLNTL
jgi:hypothetical protein